MNYLNLWQGRDPVRVGLIGTGAFGRNFVGQARRNPMLRVRVVCDRRVEAARSACLQAGMAEDEMALCTSRQSALAALEAGKCAIVEDGTMLAELPIDAVVEATGIPEAGALHAVKAIEGGKHVVMVTKETDSIAGPILTKLAAGAGVVYTLGDGDHPSLLVGLIGWAHSLGFEVACAGKASASDFIWDAGNLVEHGGDQADFDGVTLWQNSGQEVRTTVARRTEQLHALSRPSVADLCEMGMVMNVTGLGYDRPQLHAPVARIVEMADLFCSTASGGILDSEGVIDMVNCLRRKDEAGFAGGVFVVVKLPDRVAGQMLKSKGHLVNRQGSHAMFFRPYHLLGVETGTSALAVALGISASGGREVRPRVDLCARTTQALKAGSKLAMGHEHTLSGIDGELRPAQPIGDDNPIPFYLAVDSTLKVDVAANTLLTYGMLSGGAVGENSVLWALRRKQDVLFFA